MSHAVSSSLAADARFEIIVETEGILPFPLAVARQVGLKPGDFLSVERLAASLHFEPYAAFLEAIWEALPPECLWNEAERFLARPLTVLEERGLHIPRGLFRLRPGDQVILQALSRGLSPEIYLYPADLVTAGRWDLAIEER